MRNIRMLSIIAILFFDVKVKYFKFICILQVNFICILQVDFYKIFLYSRRIGKTTIITKFIENKDAIFFTAQEVNDKSNLEQISIKIFKFFSMPLSTPSFKAWENVFDFLYEKAKNTQFVLAFDEFHLMLALAERHIIWLRWIIVKAILKI